MIKLRDATKKDSMFIWILRNSPDVRAVSLNKGLIPYDQHKRWFAKHYKEYKIIGQNWGYVRQENKEISIALVESMRGQGIAPKVLQQMKGSAIVLLKNKKSLKAFIKSGFKIKGYYLER